ncbi:MAG: BON domain-containing protein [Armatimonadota bacterium]|nr:BON domain-containing protein [Armatimonadota bacterium]MDR7438692.1 BON domain-containing protein [Armatimonadota bacterium]MDR7563734.1 BON domain-containing protein [Armatimonadota bacterium]MDR7567312.1 BON domain-containing protein [Armatimonadota bacterium]MDR7602550.1 BON domain-containing protein [Armatimonadota bacterium]
MTGRPADTRRHRRVVRELQVDTRVDPERVQARVENGIAILTGRVSGAVEKFAAQEAAHRVPGVLDVVNHLSVQGLHPAPASDLELARAVRRALRRHLPTHQRVRSAVECGWVTLTGTVPSGEDRERVEELVQAIPGVRGVVNMLAIEGSCVPDRLGHVARARRPG